MGEVTVFTVGHSTRTAPELLDLLEEHGVRVLADVRSRPGSKRHPHFAREALERAATERGIAYRWLGRELGGYRGRARADSPHVALDSFRSYADHMGSEAFRAGVARLLELAREAPAACLCAERDWRRCHRRFLADHLCAVEGVEVVHLLDRGRSEPHRADPRARVADRRLIYDRGVQRPLF